MTYKDIIIKNLAKLGYEGDQLERLTRVIGQSPRFLSQTGGVILSDQYFDFDGKTKATAAILGVDQDLILRSALYEPFILIRDPETIGNNAYGAATTLGIKAADYIQALLPHHAHILNRPADTINANVRGSAEALGMKLNEYIGLCMRQRSLFAVDRDDINRVVDRATIKLGLTRTQYIRAGRKDPSLFYKNPDTTDQNVTAVAELLGLTKKAYLALLIKQGQEQLMTRDPATFKNNIDTVCTELEIETTAYIKTARERLTILAYTPETLLEKVRDMARLLGVSEVEARNACLKAPQLFTLDMQKVNDKVERLAGLLGVKKGVLAPKLVRQGPTALYQDPEAINKRIEKVSELTGIDKETYIKMAMKKINLMWRSPEAVARNFGLLKLFNEKGIISPDVRAFYENKPDILAVAPTNFHVRYLYARMAGLKDQPAFTVLRDPRSKIERKLVAAFGHDPDQPVVTRPVKTGGGQPLEERRHRAMVGLISRGTISNYSYQPEPTV